MCSLRLIVALICLSSSIAAAATPTTGPAALSAEEQAIVAGLDGAVGDADKLRRMSAIGATHDPRFVDALVTRTRDSSSAVAIGAVRALGMIGEDNATYELDAVASDPQVPADVRMAACSQLATIAINRRTENVIDALLRLAANKPANGRDFVAEKAASESARVFKAARAVELLRLAHAGSDDVQQAANAELARRGPETVEAERQAEADRAAQRAAMADAAKPRDKGDDAATPKPTPAAVAAVATDDAAALFAYAKDRRKVLSAEIAGARQRLNARPSLFGGGNRDAARAELALLQSERAMLSSGDPVRIGATIELAAVAAAERCGNSRALESMLNAVDDVMPDHVVNRVTYADGHSEEYYDAGTEMANLFVGIGAMMAQANARAAQAKYDECVGLLQRLAPETRAKVHAMAQQVAKVRARRR